MRLRDFYFSVCVLSMFGHFTMQAAYENQGGEPSSIIRDGDWKLIFYHEDLRCELYNLAIKEEAKVKLRWRTKLLEQKEKDRLKMLGKDWKPNKDWWGSMVTVD